MSEAPTFNWVDAGASALAVCDSIMRALIAKGVISDADRLEIFDSAIRELNTNPELSQAADNIRTIFRRP